jgi:hypothetical protein
LAQTRFLQPWRYRQAVKGPQAGSFAPDDFRLIGERGAMMFKYSSAFPRREAPEVWIEFCAFEEKRAQGRPGARRTRGLVCKMHE